MHIPALQFLFNWFLVIKGTKMITWCAFAIGVYSTNMTFTKILTTKFGTQAGAMKRSLHSIPAPHRLCVFDCKEKHILSIKRIRVYIVMFY